jgi:hypothetical protein
MKEYGDVSMTFHPDGTLTYVLQESGKDNVILLTWRTEGKEIVTDQPTKPRHNRTGYTFSSEGKLLLRKGRSVSQYVRGG